MKKIEIRKLEMLVTTGPVQNPPDPDPGGGWR
jgi:hypothetical protein